MDRSTNVFGIPEQNLLTKRALVDDICEYLSGKVVSIKDLFRLVKRPPTGEGSDPAHPRPVLVKLTTIWDKRLLLFSKQKLKAFRLSRIFVRPDLSPEERATRKYRNIPNATTFYVLPSASNSKLVTTDVPLGNSSLAHLRPLQVNFLFPVGRPHPILTTCLISIIPYTTVY